MYFKFINYNLNNIINYLYFVFSIKIILIFYKIFTKMYKIKQKMYYNLNKMYNKINTFSTVLYHTVAIKSFKAQTLCYQLFFIICKLDWLKLILETNLLFTVTSTYFWHLSFSFDLFILQYLFIQFNQMTIYYNSN